MQDTLAHKEAALREFLEGCDGIAVALSGGVDSTLLMDVAHEVLGPRALALTACTASFPERERLAVRAFCEERGIRQIEVDSGEFSVPGFTENPPDRCYHCKRALFSTLLPLAAAEGISVLAEGSNLDDEQDYRPGLAALGELDIVSPLKRAGFTKGDIRALSRERGLATWDKPACACLASRVPYGTEISPELLLRIDRAEQCLLDTGIRQVRVRVHDDLARIEVAEGDVPLFASEGFRHGVTACLQELGFTYVTLDLMGYRTGSLTRAL
jgi:uncharacterized protein